PRLKRSSASNGASFPGPDSCRTWPTKRYRTLLNSEKPSHHRQPFHRVGELLDQTNQQGGLSVGLGPTLLPVFQSAGVGAQIAGKHWARQVQALAQGQQLVGSHVRHRVDFHLVCAQRLLAGSRIRQGIEALGNLCKQVTLFHCLTSNSALNMLLSAF